MQLVYTSLIVFKRWSILPTKLCTVPLKSMCPLSIQQKKNTVQATILLHLPGRASMRSVAQCPVAMLFLNDKASVMS